MACNVNVGVIRDPAKKADDLVFRKISVYVHEHLNLEGKVNSVRLLLKRWISLTLNQIVSLVWVESNFMVTNMGFL